MRDILFRGKNAVNGESRWIYGDLVHVNDRNGRRFLEIWVPLPEGERDPNNLDYGAVNPATVGQYTGLCDKNGKKIFEGDIVRFKRTDALGWTRERVGQVLYYGKLPIFYILATTGDAWDWYLCEDIEVLGNIHDNPELLEDRT